MKNVLFVLFVLASGLSFGGWFGKKYTDKDVADAVRHTRGHGSVYLGTADKIDPASVRVSKGSVDGRWAVRYITTDEILGKIEYEAEVKAYKGEQGDCWVEFIDMKGKQLKAAAPAVTESAQSGERKDFVNVSSLFGVKIGVSADEVDVPHDEKPTVSYYNGKVTTICYNFTPNKRFRDFDIYRFYICPKSGLITTVCAERRRMASQEDAVAEQQVVVEIMKKRFGVEFSLNGNGAAVYSWMTPYLERRCAQGGNSLSVHGTWGYGDEYKGYVEIRLHSREVEERAIEKMANERTQRISADVNGIDAL